MYSRNKIELIGHLGADPETLYTPTGKRYCRLRLATTERWKGDDGQVHEATEWHRITLWGSQGEIAAKYAAKGSYILIEGRLKSNKFTDKDGIERTSWEVQAQRIGLLDRKREGTDEPLPESDLPPAAGDDSIPF